MNNFESEQSEQLPREGGVQNEDAMAGNEVQQEQEAGEETTAEGDQEPVNEIGEAQQKKLNEQQQENGQQSVNKRKFSLLPLISRNFVE